MSACVVALLLLVVAIIQRPRQWRRQQRIYHARFRIIRSLQLNVTSVSVMLLSCGDAAVFPAVSPLSGTQLPPSSACARDSQLLMEAAGNRTLWAVRMVDASALSVVGALFGGRFQLGSFDGCLSAGAVSPVGSRYCLVELSPMPLPPEQLHPLPPWDHVTSVDPHQDVAQVLQGSGLVAGSVPPGEVLVAMCVPRSCSAAELEVAVQRSVGLHAATWAGTAFRVGVKPDLCVHSDETEETMTGWTTVALWVLMAVLTGASITGSLLGWTSWNSLAHLSALGRPEPAVAGMDLSALSGVRCITAVVLVGAHRALHSARLPHANTMLLTTHSRQSALHTLGHHAQVFVDTMIFLSGLLAALNLMTSTRQSFVRMALNRYLRLTPTYALIVWLYAAGMRGAGSGPLWKWIVGTESMACQRWWWANLLYVNNYVHGGLGEKGCMLQSWTLAVDMHLFLLCAALLPLLPAEASRRRAMLAAALLASLLPLFVSTLVHRYPPLMLWTGRTSQDVFADPMFLFAYIPTHMRMTPYLVGVLVADVLVLFKNARLTYLSTHLVTWLSSLVLLLTLLSSVVFSDPTQPSSPLVAALYASLTPLVWSVSLGALVLALVLGHHTLVRGLLHWQPLVTLSRLTYGVYLVHFLLQLLQGGAQRTPMNITLATVVLHSFADVVAAFFLSTYLYVIVEAPVRTLAKKVVSFEILDIGSMVDVIYWRRQSFPFVHFYTGWSFKNYFAFSKLNEVVYKAISYKPKYVLYRWRSFLNSPDSSCDKLHSE